MADAQLDHPRDRIARLSAQRGEPAVVEGCITMLAGNDADPVVVDALGGRHANRVIDHTTGEYWGRVWGARGLLYVWGDEAIPVLRAAVRDEHWRVREMVAKVVAKHRLDELAADVAPLRADGVPRVRAAAERALIAVATPRRG
jgi:HEAT repeats